MAHIEHAWRRSSVAEIIDGVLLGHGPEGSGRGVVGATRARSAVAASGFTIMQPLTSPRAGGPRPLGNDHDGVHPGDRLAHR